MKALLLVALLAPALASAQVQASASFSIDLPIVLPQLVIIEPGIRVVPGIDVEVFQVDGFYWTQREGRWYRSKSHRGGWVYMDRGVPPGLRRMPPGKYKRWKPAPAARMDDRGGRDRHEGHDRHDDRGGKHKGGKKHGKRD
jgi:hypothetical protein